WARARGRLRRQVPGGRHTPLHRRHHARTHAPRLRAARHARSGHPRTLDVGARAGGRRPRRAGDLRTRNAAAREMKPESAMARRSSKLRLATLALVAALPGFLKRPLYRHLFGYRVGRRVRLGLSIIDARECEIADDVSIGHLNLIVGVWKLSIGDHARIG